MGLGLDRSLGEDVKGAGAWEGTSLQGPARDMLMSRGREVEWVWKGVRAWECEGTGVWDGTRAYSRN